MEIGKLKNIKIKIYIKLFLYDFGLCLEFPSYFENFFKYLDEKNEDKISELMMSGILNKPSDLNKLKKYYSNFKFKR